MTTRRSDDESSRNPHDGAATSWATSWARSGAGHHGETQHDRCEVDLTTAERRCFDEIVAPMWALRITRGRRSAVFGRGGTCLVVGLAGIVGSVIALAALPLVVSFTAFVLAVVAFAELSEHAAGSSRCRWATKSFGLVVTACELSVVAIFVASAFVVRAVRRST